MHGIPYGEINQSGMYIHTYNVENVTEVPKEGNLTPFPKMNRMTRIDDADIVISKLYMVLGGEHSSLNAALSTTEQRWRPAIRFIGCV